MPLIDQAMREAALSPGELDLVAVTAGPGSFTAIRAGLAAARGIALATGALLLGLSGFEAVAASFPFPGATQEEGPKEGPSLLVALESRRADLYVALFDDRGEPLLPPLSLLPEALAAALGGAPFAKGLVIAGDAAVRAAAALPTQSVTRIEAERVPDALGVLRAAFRSWRRGVRENAARPMYLRAPDVTIPRAKKAKAR